MRYLRLFAVFCFVIIALNVSYLYVIRKSSSPIQIIQERSEVKSELVQAKIQLPEVQPDKVADVVIPSPSINPKDNPNLAPVLFQKNVEPEFVLGLGRKEKVSLVIGVPTVRRDGVSYLYSALNSLVRCIYPDEEDDVSIVVFIAEIDEEYVRREARHIYGNFTREVESGLLQIIGPPKDFYPDFGEVPETLGDSTTRVRWRSKEVLDAALAMHYCRHKADYYVMTEDDVIVSHGYTSAIRKFARERFQQDYVYLSFSSLGSIGKVFRTRDLAMWFSYFLTFFNHKPIDWLMRDLVNFIKCNEGISREVCLDKAKGAVPELHYSVFQHIGTKSSLIGKIQNLKSDMFRDHVTLSIKHKNPDAKITSTLSSVQLSQIESWYLDSGGMTQSLWISSMRKNEAITFLFPVPLGASRIFIRSGSVNRNSDKRVCPKCVSLEVLPSSDAQRQSQTTDAFTPCAESDLNGNIECKTTEPIVSLRIKANKDIVSNIWFDFIYVGPRKTNSNDESSRLLAGTDVITDDSLFTKEGFTET